MLDTIFFYLTILNRNFFYDLTTPDHIQHFDLFLRGKETTDQPKWTLLTLYFPVCPN